MSYQINHFLVKNPQVTMSLIVICDKFECKLVHMSPFLFGKCQRNKTEVAPNTKTRWAVVMLEMHYNAPKIIFGACHGAHTIVLLSSPSLYIFCKSSVYKLYTYSYDVEFLWIGIFISIFCINFVYKL